MFALWTAIKLIIDYLFLHGVVCLPIGVHALFLVLNSNIFNFMLQAGQPELIALEKALKEAMVPAGKAREVIFSFTYHFQLHLVFFFFYIYI